MRLAHSRYSANVLLVLNIDRTRLCFRGKALKNKLQSVSLYLVYILHLSSVPSSFGTIHGADLCQLAYVAKACPRNRAIPSIDLISPLHPQSDWACCHAVCWRLRLFSNPPCWLPIPARGHFFPKSHPVNLLLSDTTAKVAKLRLDSHSLPFFLEGCFCFGSPLLCHSCFLYLFLLPQLWLKKKFIWCLLHY